MARALSQIVTVIRGSIGGITFTANQWHQILLRARTAPVQPQTVAQNHVKNAFNHASLGWEDLSDGDRELWDQYGDTVTYTGPMGNYTLPGRQIFMASQTFLQYLRTTGLLITNVNPDPPEIAGRTEFDSVTTGAPSAPGIGFELSVSNDTDETLCFLAEHSPVFNETRLRYKGPFASSTAQAHSIPSRAVTSVDFLGLIKDKVYFVRVRGCTVNTPGRLTRETILRVVAQETGV